ncbi:hypothetical protein [Streptomyces sp. YU58]|uniref:hypothetical protein n=1 Tax=Streptomyces sp. SX92 TaxID=3158972 RepID=UPI0027B980BA|nr:hypothetical protein [Streptomyces coralus]WLW56794.1 hypothetical protein QU709_37945 [Streptomyces coralus]
MTHNQHSRTAMGTILVPVLVGTLTLGAAVIPTLTSYAGAPDSGGQGDYIQPTISVRREQQRPVPAPSPLPAPSSPTGADAGPPVPGS